MYTEKWQMLSQRYTFSKRSTVQGLESIFRSHCHKFFLLMFLASSLALLLLLSLNVKGKVIQNTCDDKLFGVKLELPTSPSLKNHSPHCQYKRCDVYLMVAFKEGRLCQPCSALNSPSHSILNLPVGTSLISPAVLGSLSLSWQNGRSFMSSSLPDAE